MLQSRLYLLPTVATAYAVVSVGQVARNSLYNLIIDKIIQGAFLYSHIISPNTLTRSTITICYWIVVVLFAA